MADVVKYGELGIKSIDVYNQCNLDYYLIAAGNSFNSVSGFVNFSVNIVWRYFDTTTKYDEWAAGLAAHDYNAVGESFGTFFKDMFATELPDASLDLVYQQIGASAKLPEGLF